MRNGARDSGYVMLAVMIVSLVIAASSASFIWFMGTAQTRSGARHRLSAAMAAAEAGVHRALAALETVAPGGVSGRVWRPEEYSEEMGVGFGRTKFTLSVSDGPGGAVNVESVGQVAETSRRIRARVYLTSPALQAALYSAGVVRLERSPARLIILPYWPNMEDRRWFHVAAGREVWFATTQVSLNIPSGVEGLGPGPVVPRSIAQDEARNPSVDAVRFLLGPGGELTVDRHRHRTDLQQLQANGILMRGQVIRASVFPVAPDVDRDYYRAQARANVGNAYLNSAAGKYFADASLHQKLDSLYTRREFEQIQTYLQLTRGLRPLTGVIHVNGGLTMGDGQRLWISEGALVVDGTVYIGEGAVLRITHTARTRTLPGIITLGHGALIVSQASTLEVHGLVYVSRVFEARDGARVDVIGAVVANDPGLSFRNFASAVLVRYDPAVMGTPGLRVPLSSPALAWVAEWEEVP